MIQNNLEHLWMPFSANRDFKASPRMMNEGKGMYYRKPDGTPVLDGTAGLWCCNAGHGHEKIVHAIQDQAAKLDFAPHFRWGTLWDFRLRKNCCPSRLLVNFNMHSSQIPDLSLWIQL